jgi:Tfp pilus assembly protein PilZ
MILPDLVIAPSAKGGEGGLGVFTTRAFEVGTIVEISPVLPLTKAERTIVEATKLYYYIFEWGPEEGAAAIGLGYISMYNHSFDSNCEYEMDFEEGTMSVKTVKPIAVGEELFINYNGDADDNSPVWFDVL